MTKKMKPAKLFALSVIVVALVVAGDRLTKYIVEQNISLGEQIPFIGDFIRFTYAQNDGIAFSLFSGGDFRLGLILIQCILVAVVAVVMVFVYRKFSSPWLVVCFSLMLGGGIGNLIDRISTGVITDFISIGTFPVFNVADSALVIGCVLMLVYVVFLMDRKTPQEESK